MSKSLLLRKHSGKGLPWIRTLWHFRISCSFNRKFNTRWEVFVEVSVNWSFTVWHWCQTATHCLLNFHLSGPVCWNDKAKSYGRGVGTIPSSRCPSHRPDKNGGLCYKRCRSGYKTYGCCLCMKGWDIYGRGGGTVPELRCPSNRPDKDGGLCYPNCRAEYTGVSLRIVCCQPQFCLHTKGGSCRACETGLFGVIRHSNEEKLHQPFCMLKVPEWITVLGILFLAWLSTSVLPLAYRYVFKSCLLELRHL